MSRRIWTALGAVMFVVAAVAFIVRFVPIVNRPRIVTAALAPYLMLGAPIAALVALRYGAPRDHPAAAVDHILTRGCTATSVHTLSGARLRPPGAGLRLRRAPVTDRRPESAR
jgi:hypothetical protein